MQLKHGHQISIYFLPSRQLGLKLRKVSDYTTLILYLLYCMPSSVLRSAVVRKFTSAYGTISYSLHSELQML